MMPSPPGNNSLIVRHPGVEMADPSTIDPFVVLGAPTMDLSLTTHIGPHAVIRSHTVIYAGNVIGSHFQTGHGVLIRESNQIGDHVSVGSHSVVEYSVIIGHGVRIHSQAFIPEFTILEDEAWIGPCVCLTNARYPRSQGVKEALRGPIIGKRAKIGGGAIILPGITIGMDALIGAGAVITQDVPPGAVVVGNPSRIIKNIRDISAYQQHQDTSF
jgi:acetyltransferase-like isoleucine patch superfamily enzyme